MIEYQTRPPQYEFVHFDKSCNLFTVSAVNGLDENEVVNEWMHKSVTLRNEPCDKASKSNESKQICGVAMYRRIKNVFYSSYKNI